MALYSYVLKRDTGFAPNPYFGVCSLATCKPQIRARAAVGDWVIGTTSRRYAEHGPGLVYAMRVSEIHSFRTYTATTLGAAKTPTAKDSLTVSGDAIYRWNGRAGQYEQLDNPFHGALQVARDLSADRILCAEQFIYLGRSWLPFPLEFASIVKRGPGHRIIREPERMAAFVRWLEAEMTARGLRWGSVGTPNDFEDAKKYRWVTARRGKAACA